MELEPDLATLAAEAPLVRLGSPLAGVARARCLELLAHDAANLRVYAAGRIAASWPEDASQLARLWRDTAIVEVGTPGSTRSETVRWAALVRLGYARAHPQARAELDRLARDRTVHSFRANAFPYVVMDAATARAAAREVLGDARASEGERAYATQLLRPFAEDEDVPLILGDTECPRRDVIEHVAQLAQAGGPRAMVACTKLLAASDPQVASGMRRAARMAELESTATQDSKLRALADLAGARSVTSRQIGYSAEKSESFMLFDHVARASTPAEIVALLDHPSAIVRGYAARHVLETMIARADALLPLIRHTAPIETMSGCMVGETTLGAFVFEELLRATDRPEVYALMRSAVLDPAVGPFRARGISLLRREGSEIASSAARAILVGHPGSSEALRELASDLRVSDLPLVARAVATSDYVFPVVAEAIGALAARAAEAKPEAVVMLESLRTRPGSAIRDAADRALRGLGES